MKYVIFFNKSICVSTFLHTFKWKLKMLFTIVLAYFSGYGESDKSFVRGIFWTSMVFSGPWVLCPKFFDHIFLNRVRPAGSGLV